MNFLRRVLRHAVLIVAIAGLGSAQTYLFNRANFGVGNLPISAVAADFNGDGLADVAVANGNDNTVSILLRKPNGTFAPQTTFPTATEPASIAAASPPM